MGHIVWDVLAPLGGVFILIAAAIWGLIAFFTKNGN
jgi:hypothetical protein